MANAVLVNLSISQWSGRRFDKKATEEINSTHGATNAGRFNKLLVDQEIIKALTKKASAIRTFHREQTLPWGDNGDRILPAKNFLDYMNQMNSLIADYEDEINSFMASYDRAIADAQIKLNTLYNPNDYPSKEEMRAKFSVTTTLNPVPEENHITDMNLGGIPDGQMEAIRAQINSDVVSRHEEAIKELVQRAKDAVQRIVHTLSEAKDKVFRNTMVTNISDMIELFPKLNYTNDPRINDIIREMQSLVIDPDSLRSDDIARENYLKRAKELDKMFF